MPEILTTNHETQNPQDQEHPWEELKKVPFAGEETTAENQETDKPQYETELTSPKDVLNDIQSFEIQNGIVFSKETGDKVTDEDTILRAKTSRFLFNEARALRDSAANANGDKFVDRGPEYYVDRAMERFAIRDEENGYGTNKLIHELIETGRHEQPIGSDTLAETKYDMFDGKKADYGKALIKRKFRQRGIDMEDLRIKIDTTNFKRDGVSDVIIEVGTKPLVSSKESAGESFHHPAAEQLKGLEKGLTEAIKDRDTDAIKGYREAIKTTVLNNPLEVKPEEWDEMNDDQKRRFYELKMRESKAAGDDDSYDFWRANLETQNKQ